MKGAYDIHGNLRSLEYHEPGCDPLLIFFKENQQGYGLPVGQNILQISLCLNQWQLSYSMCAFSCVLQDHEQILKSYQKTALSFIR